MTSGLATLVAGIWTEAGYETTISHRDGQTYVLAEHGAAGTYDLLWVLDPGTELTVEGIERYRSRIADLDVADAYAVTAAALDDRVVERAARHGIEAVGVETLRSLAAESGVGQDAVDAALATTVGAEGEGEADDAEGERESTAVGGDPSDPDTQAEIRRRMAVMMGEVDPDEEPDSGGSTGEDHADEDGSVVPAAEAGGGGGGADESATPDDATDDEADTEETDPEPTAGEGDDDPLGDDGGDDLDPLGGSDLPGDGLPEDPATDDGDGGGPLSSRRGLITGGVAAVLSAGVLDFAVFNVFLGGGGGGLPAYNETRVKANAAPDIPPDVMLQAPEQWTDEPVTYETAVVETVSKSGGLWTVTFAAEGGRIVGRWDGEEPTVGTTYTVWGVVTGTTTVDGTEVPKIDVVDMTTGGAGGGGGGGTTTGGTGTASGENATSTTGG